MQHVSTYESNSPSRVFIKGSFEASTFFVEGRGYDEDISDEYASLPPSGFRQISGYTSPRKANELGAFDEMISIDFNEGEAFSLVCCC